MMLTTGILMFGKMSVGVRKIASVPRIKIKIASTMNVYGRFSATLTIHMTHAPIFLSSAAGLFRPGDLLWSDLRKGNPHATSGQERNCEEVLENKGAYARMKETECYR